MTAPSHPQTIAGLELPIVETALGPRISPEGEITGLAIVVNVFLNGALPQLWEGVLEGWPVHVDDLYAEPLPESADPTVALEPWRRLSGSRDTQDPLRVGASEGEFVLPRLALLTILDAMKKLNAPGPRAASDPDAGSAAGALALAVANRPGSPGRAEELERLERRARDLEAMSDPAEAAARRRTLLIELDGAGLLSGRAGVADELNKLELPTLLGYHRAARRLLDYLASPERRELVPGAVLGPVLGARVSLDFFREGPKVPAGRTEDGWAALGEAMLLPASPRPTVQGFFYAQWDGRWYEVRWRRDDGNTPALLELLEQ